MRDADAERGVALLTVLMLVAVVAVIAGAALEKLRLSTRLAGNAGAVMQAQSYARAAEALALSRVDALLGQSSQRVTLDGGWSGRPFPLPVPDGVAIARVADGGNCFNLNSLVSPVAPGVYQSNPIARAQFARLLRLIGVPGQVGEQVAAGASDWIDTDSDQQSGGAEDPRYTGQATPYRTSGTLMADPSELRAVAGVTPDLYATLAPWVCTLPTTDAAPVNVNTLTPEQAPLAAMLAPDTVAAEAVRGALIRRPAGGYQSADRFWAQVGGTASGTAAVTTRWFALTVDVTLGGIQLHQTSLIDASRLPSRLVSRQWGEP